MSQITLVHDRRFWPLFWTQFLGAFNDNFFKNALVILITYRALSVAAMAPEQVVALCAGLFILPFFLFSATAGQLADRFPKSTLIPWIKFLEIVVMALAAVGFLTGSLPFLLAVLFLMGFQSTLFGPIKYGILPQLLKEDELVGGNALVETGTFLAILLGTIGGGLLIALEGIGPWVVSAGIIGFAVLGFMASLFIKKVPAEAPRLKVRLNPITPTWEIFKFTRQTQSVYRSILGVAWFWFVGASLLALFPNYCKDILHGDEHVITFFLALFSIGIGVGSMLCERLSQHRLELGLVPFGSIGMTAFLFDLFWAGDPYEGVAAPAGLAGIGAFLAAPGGIRITLDLLLLSVFSGFYIVPLMTLVQQRTAPSHRSRVIAGSNVLSSLFMVISAGFLMGIHALGIPIPKIFLILTLLNLAVAVHIYVLIPEFLYRFLAWILANTMYRLRVTGLEHIPAEGPAVLVANHVSFVDWLIVGGAVKRPVRFVMHYSFLRLRGLRWLFRQGHVIPIAGEKENSVVLARAFQRISQELAAGELVCIFPEGRLTHDGSILPFHKGIEKIVEDNAVPVIPIALRGMWGGFFTRKYGKAMTRPFRRFWARIHLNIGRPIPPERVSAPYLQQVVASLRGRAE